LSTKVTILVQYFREVLQFDLQVADTENAMQIVIYYMHSKRKQ